MSESNSALRRQLVRYCSQTYRLINLTRASSKEVGMKVTKKDLKLFGRIAAVYCDNVRIVHSVGMSRDYYVHGGTLPPGVERLSSVLRCEQSNAHKLLEDVFSAIKGYSRGNIPKRAVEHWLRDSSLRLLDSLRGTAKLLPSAMNVKADKLIAAIGDAGNIEYACANFILGLSGGGSDIGPTEWSARLDGFLRDLKSSFNAISSGFDAVEIELERLGKARQPVRTAKRKVTRRGGTEADAVKAKDIAAIRKEVSRRAEAKWKRGIATNLKDELMLLYKDDAWSRRCRQWRPDTLYSYIIRR